MAFRLPQMTSDPMQSISMEPGKHLRHVHSIKIVSVVCTAIAPYIRHSHMIVDSRLSTEQPVAGSPQCTYSINTKIKKQMRPEVVKP